MRKLRLKEVPDHTTSKWWNKNEFRAQALRHPWGSEMFTKIITDGTGMWMQACLSPKPSCCVTTMLCCPTLSAGQDHLLAALWIITAKNLAVCKYLLSVFLATNPHPTAPIRPSRLLPRDAWLEWVAPSFSQPPPGPICVLLAIFANSHSELRLCTRSFRRGGGLSWHGVTSDSHRTGIDWINQCIFYVTKFIL